MPERVRRALAVVALTIATLSAVPTTPADATIYYPCGVGTSTDAVGRHVVWGECVRRPPSHPEFRQWRVWARFCTSGTCVTKKSTWRDWGTGRARVKSSLGDTRIVLDIRYR